MSLAQLSHSLFCLLFQWANSKLLHQLPDSVCWLISPLKVFCTVKIQSKVQKEKGFWSVSCCGADQKFFWDQKFCWTKFFWPNSLLGSIFFNLTFCFDQHFFGAKNFFWPNIFSGQIFWNPELIKCTKQ